MSTFLSEEYTPVLEPGRDERLRLEENLVKTCVDKTLMPAKYRRHPILDMHHLSFDYVKDDNDLGDERCIPVILPEGWKLQTCEDHNYLQLCNPDNEVVFECFVRAFGGYPHWITC